MGTIFGKVMTGKASKKEHASMETYAWPTMMPIPAPTMPRVLFSLRDLLLGAEGGGGQVWLGAGTLVAKLLVTFLPSYQLPVTSHQLPVTSYQSTVTSYLLPVAGHGTLVPSYQIPVTSYQLPVTSCQLPGTSYYVARRGTLVTRY